MTIFKVTWSKGQVWCELYTAEEVEEKIIALLADGIKPSDIRVYGQQDLTEQYRDLMY